MYDSSSITPVQSKLPTFLAVSFGILALILGILAGYFSFNYYDQVSNVDQKVAQKWTEESKRLNDELEAKTIEREKEPLSQFTGPDDFGRLLFLYPKTWSVYINNNSNPYEAYLNPGFVPPVQNNKATRYALRILIENIDYNKPDKALSAYQKLIEKGDLKASAVTIDNVSGTRLDGAFSSDIRGSAVIYNIRDKVVTLRTDADIFKPDFEKIIQSITFNK